MRRSTIVLAILALLPWGPAALSAQEAGVRYVPAEAFVGSEIEQYFRLLQVAGVVAPHPWTVRAIPPRTLRELVPEGAAHPWADRLAFGPPPERFGLSLLSPAAGLIYNSAFPYGSGDGAVWAGRGATGVVRAGLTAHAGPLELVLAPEAFVTQNRGFDLTPGPGADADEELRFRDPQSPRNIDVPQRFGEDSYGRVDAGESSLRLYLPGSAVGMSTASQHFGPAVHFPLMLGNNAGGFPHAFIETVEPLDLWLVRLHGRWIAGRTAQSDFSPIAEGEGSKRLTTAVIAVLEPRGLDGLEVGGVSFAHAVWPEEGVSLSDVLAPIDLEFAGGRKNADEGEINHLASLFFRWAIPDGGIEVYGEFSREDWSPDARHLIREPDDLSGYMLGLQKTWLDGRDRLTAFRAEMVNSQVPHQERGDRGIAAPYRHSGLRQGHTHRGQLLAAPEARGGAGFVVGVDRVRPDDAWSVELRRALRFDWLPRDIEAEPDVVYSVRAETLRFMDDFAVRLAVEPAVELNRHLEEGNDAFNLNVSLRVTHR